MTQAVSPVDQAASHLQVHSPTRIARPARRSDTAVGAPPARLGWPIRDRLAVTGGAGAVLVVATLVGLPLSPWLGVALVVCWPALLAWQGSFVTRPLGEPLGARASRVLRAGCALGLLSWASAALLGAPAAPAVMIPATALVTATGLAAVSVGGARRSRARVLLVGHADDLPLVASELARTSASEVVAGCVPRGIVHGCEFPVSAGVDSAVGHASRHGADTLVVMPGPDIRPDLVRRLQWQASSFGMATYLSTGLLDVASFRMSLASGPGPNLLHVRLASSTGLRRLSKEVCERALAGLALLLLAPLLAVVAAVVRLDSSGPALFRQVRVGRNGETFVMHKFRTMSCAAEDERAELEHHNEGAGVLFKLRVDPRVTRVGGLLRRYSLDELPQLWNVVNGSMALVGPRPALPAEVAKYNIDTRRRLDVKPGITGLWQVSGRSDLDWEQSVRLDLRYVDNWSLGLDLSIFVRTLRAVLNHRGAY